MRNEQLGMRNELRHGNKEQRTKGSGFLALLTVSCYLLFGCVNTMEPPQQSALVYAGYGRVSVSFAGGQGAAPRTVFPAMAFDNYVYTFTKGGVSNGTTLVPDSDGLFTLEVGEWSLDVQAYVGAIEPDNLVAAGTGNFTVSSGATAGITVALEGVVSAGYGTFTCTVQYPAIADIAITLQKLPELTEVDLTPDSKNTDNDVTLITKTAEDVSAGYYLLTVLVSKGGWHAGASEIVHIYPLLAAAYEAEFDEDDLLPSVVDIADIEGISAVIGQAPATAITATEQYTGTVTWDPNPETFAATTTYTATVTLTAKEGYTLQDIPENFFTAARAGSVSNAAGSGEITAVFITPRLLTVTFNINDGSGTAPSSQSVGSGFSITLPDGSGFSRSGYIFGGWNTNNSGTGTNYSADSSFTPTGNITLYARWLTTYTVTFLSWGSTVTQQTVGSGMTATRPDDPDNPSFSFGGWYTDAELSQEWNFNTPITANRTIYAKWQTTDSDPDFVPGTVISQAITVVNDTQLQNVASTINSYGNNKNFIINVGANISSGVTPSFSRTNITVVIRSTDVSGNRTISRDSMNFSPWNVANTQKIILRDINLGMPARVRATGTLEMKGTSKIVGEYVLNEGTFIMSDDTVVKDSEDGTAVTSSGTFIMRDNATVTNNRASNNSSTSGTSGGGVRITGGTFTMQNNAAVSNNSLARSNSSSYSGGGVYVANGTFTMQDNATVSGNSVSTNYSYSNWTYGGGVYLASGAFIMQDNASVSNNSVSSVRNSSSNFTYGGGVYVDKGTFTMRDNACISGNVVRYPVGKDSGGCGVYVSSGGTFRIQGGTIYGGTYHIEGNDTHVLDNGSNSNYHYEIGVSLSLITDNGKSALHNDNGTAVHGVFNGNVFTQRGVLGSTSDNIIVVNGDLQQ